MIGKIKFYNEVKKYGFILGNDLKNYFFHISEIKFTEAIQRGHRVEFQIREKKKGYIAIDINLLNNDLPISNNDANLYPSSRVILTATMDEYTKYC